MALTKEMKERYLKAAQDRANGCPLFEGREKGDLGDLEGEEVTLEAAYPLTGDKGHYYAVWFEEEKTLFYLSSSALTAVIDEAEPFAAEAGVSLDEVIAGTKIRIGKQRRTKTGNNYRPVEVIG